jgi:MFS family permease
MQTVNLKVRQAIIVVLLFLFMVLNMADKAVLGIVAIPMMKELHLSPAKFGMVASSFFLLYSVSTIAFGFLADKFKAKTLLTVLALIWAITQFPVAWWASLPVLFICRILLGVGEGPAYPLAVHAAYKWFPDNQRNLVTAVLAQGGPTGLVVAAPILSLLLVTYGWRSAFLMLGLSGLVWVLLWLVLGGEGKVGAKEKKADEPVVTAEPRRPFPKLLLNRTSIGSMAGVFAAYWIVVMGFTWLPPYLNTGLGYSAVKAGWLVSVIMGCSIPLQLATAWLSQRWLQRGVSSRVARGMLMGGLIAVSGLFIAVSMLLDLGPVTKIILLALGCALPLVAFSIGPAIIGEICPSAQRGAVLSVIISFATLAGLIAPAMTGWIVQSAATPALGYTYGYLFAGGVLIVCGLIAVVLIDPVGSRARLQKNNSLDESGDVVSNGVSPAR